MAKNNLVWFVVLAAVLALVYYLYEGGSFGEVLSNQQLHTASEHNCIGTWKNGSCHAPAPSATGTALPWATK